MTGGMAARTAASIVDTQTSRTGTSQSACSIR
jgi:hypothetical protein